MAPTKNERLSKRLSEAEDKIKSLQQQLLDQDKEIRDLLSQLVGHPASHSQDQTLSQTPFFTPLSEDDKKQCIRLNICFRCRQPGLRSYHGNCLSISCTATSFSAEGSDQAPAPTKQPPSKTRKLRASKRQSALDSVTTTAPVQAHPNTAPAAPFPPSPPKITLSGLSALPPATTAALSQPSPVSQGKKPSGKQDGFDEMEDIMDYIGKDRKPLRLRHLESHVESCLEEQAARQCDFAASQQYEDNPRFL